jgi:hypothetical protein
MSFEVSWGGWRAILRPEDILREFLQRIDCVESEVRKDFDVSGHICSVEWMTQSSGSGR